MSRGPRRWYVVGPHARLASVHVSSSNVVALAALAFTILSFWMLNARRGHLRSTRPRAYAFGGSGHLLRLRFPLALLNTGAAARLVGDLRLVIETEQGKPLLRWVTTRSQLRPATDDGHAFPTPFAVHGRDTRELIAEFEPDAGLDWSPPADVPQRLRLQALVHVRREDKWINVATFDWWAPPEDKRNLYIAHRNERAS